MTNKIINIILNALPIALMVWLIPNIEDDYLLTAIYIAIIIISLSIKKNRGEIYVFLFGFFIMIAYEYLFIKTGVETFKRNSLLGLMPLWLPFLWGYGFIAIKRGLKILGI